MQAGGVPEARAVERRHRVQNFRPDGGRGSVIEIDRIGHRMNIRAVMPLLPIGNFVPSIIVLLGEPYDVPPFPIPTPDADAQSLSHSINAITGSAGTVRRERPNHRRSPTKPPRPMDLRRKLPRRYSGWRIPPQRGRRGWGTAVARISAVPT